MFRTLVSLLVAVSLSPAAAGQDMSGLFTREGIEVRADERVYTLFALLNSLGYDRELRRGPLPLKAPGYTEVRSALRSKLALAPQQLDPKPAAAHLEANPVPLERYVEQALQLEGAPGFAVPAGEAAELGALGELLKDFHNRAGGALYEEQRPLLREHAKRWVEAIDVATERGRRYARVPDEAPLEEDGFDEEEPPRVVVVVNPLDAHGVAYRVDQRSLRYLVVGPALSSAEEATDPALVAALVEMLRPYVGPALRKVGRGSVTKALASRGVKLAKGRSPYDVVLEALARSLAAGALGRPLVWPEGMAPGKPTAFDRAADSAVDWYAKQKQPLPKLAASLVARALGTKAP